METTETKTSLTLFMEDIISGLKQAGKVRTSENYAAALGSFMKYRQGKDIGLKYITPQIMEEYEAWRQGQGITRNSSSFYMRILRAVYNRAVDEDLITDRRPFRRVYTGVDKTAKRALPINVIRKINRLDLSAAPELDYARDMFMLSFMLRGMSLVDMAFLRKADLVNGHITYCRHKTGQRLSVKWTKEMQSVLAKYPDNPSGYLLPIIGKPGTDGRNAYRKAGNVINYNLKKIGRMVGAGIPLTLYVARHSWATAAKGKGIPVGVIGDCMGHTSEATTRIYLASLDTSAVDRANSLILKNI